MAKTHRLFKVIGQPAAFYVVQLDGCVFSKWITGNTNLYYELGRINSNKEFNDKCREILASNLK